MEEFSVLCVPQDLVNFHTPETLGDILDVDHNNGGEEFTINSCPGPLFLIIAALNSLDFLKPRFSTCQIQ